MCVIFLLLLIKVLGRRPGWGQSSEPVGEPLHRSRATAAGRGPLHSSVLFFFFFCNAKRGSSLFFASLPLATRVLKAARRSTNKIQSKVVGRETGWLRLTCEESTTLARLRAAREAKTNAPRRRFSFPLRTRADARDQKRNVGDAKARRPTVKTKALLYL